MCRKYPEKVNTNIYKWIKDLIPFIRNSKKENKTTIGY